MIDKLNKAKEILKMYNQEHLLQFYNELTEVQKSNLLNQIMSINFEEILYLYEKSKTNVLDTTEEAEPVKYMIKDNLKDNKLKKFTNSGIKAIKSGKVGVITLAGGQGTRLGLNAPKGTFCLDTTPPISLFEILCNYIKNFSLKFNVSIPWFIMTSTNNYFDTINFFERNNYFGYDKNDIFFFTQDNLPVINIDKKLVLSEIYKVNFASNGNGNLFTALKKSNLIKTMEQKKLEWLFVGGVDNVLLNPLDPVFIGYTINSKCKVGSKTLFKKSPSDKSWVFAIKNGKPTIIDCEMFTEEISELTDNKGNYLYRETNMLAHLFHIDAITKMSTINLPYHRAFRKNAFVNEEGMKEVPEKPNIYKFEQFVFDAFSYFDNIALLRVNEEEEFAPIKSFTGPHNPEIALERYERYVLHKQK